MIAPHPTHAGWPSLEHPGVPEGTRWKVDASGDALVVEVALDDPDDHRGLWVLLARLGWSRVREVALETATRTARRRVGVEWPNPKSGRQLEGLGRTACAALRHANESDRGATLRLSIAGFPGWSTLYAANRLDFVTDAAANDAIRRTTTLWEDVAGANVTHRKDEAGRVVGLTISKTNQSGRPAEMQRLLSPPKGSASTPAVVEQVGFRRAHHVWYEKAAHYENVWVHPSGVVLWQRAEPVPGYNRPNAQGKLELRQEHSIELSGLLVGGPPAHAAARPHLPEVSLRESVVRTLEALLRFGPRAGVVHGMEVGARRTFSAGGAPPPKPSESARPAAASPAAEPPRISGSAINPATGAPSPTPKTAPPSWVRDVPEWARPVFEHLLEHGAATELDVARLLGGPRLARRFANESDHLVALAPFDLRVEVAAGVKRYVRVERRV